MTRGKTTTERGWRLREINLDPADVLGDADAELLAGHLLDDSSYAELVTTEAVVRRPDGSLLARFCKGRVPGPVAAAAYASLRDAAHKSENRGYASGMVTEAGKDARRRRNAIDVPRGRGLRRAILREDGTVSRTTRADAVSSGIVGFFDRTTRFPFCRQTAFTEQAPEKFAAAMPFFRAVDAVFAAEVPERYAAQKAYADRSSRDFVIPGTVFSTVTVNKNWQTAVHKDRGDLRAGFGVLSVLRAGEYRGGYLVLPKYRVAFDLHTGDVLLYDVHEWHGNTPIAGAPGARHERVSCVLYYRERIEHCGTAAQEAEFAKNRRRGQPLLKAKAAPEEGP